MKILRIKFQNLNSLPSGDVDLESGPLAQAGIFAITGPTGAGKSTILDAVTLALYGRAARYGNTPPNDMMSRHAGESQAEVLFEVPRGRFVARWELRRARNKPTGNLQPVKRSIMDAHGAVLAEKVGDADRLIEELTGLDCARFLRSVLLAQGEFAQFLRADRDARAALLESLTGTQIYSDLSALAHQEFTDREQSLAQANEALGRVVLLTDEERQAKTGEAERINAELTTLAQERDAAAGRLQQGQQLAECLAASADVQSKQAVLAQTVAEASADLERLARHRLSEPFVPCLQTLDNLLSQAANDRAAHKKALAAADSARQSLTAALEAARVLGDELVASGEASLEKARAEVKLAGEKLSQLDAWLAEHALDKDLEGAFTGLVEGLIGLANGRRQHGTALCDQKKLTAEHGEVSANLVTLEQSLKAALELESNAAAAAKQACDSLAALLDGRSLEEILGDIHGIDERRNGLEQLRLAMEKRDTVVAEGLKIADEENTLTQDLEGARSQKAATIHEAETQAQILEATRKNLELLHRIASYEDQRAQLLPGQACPLCGAVKHPFVKSGAQSSASIQEAERHLAVAQAANATAAKEAELATAFLVRTEEALNGISARHAKMREEQMAAHQAFANKAAILHIFTAEALVEALADNLKAREDHHSLTGAIRSVEVRKNAAELAHATRQGEVTAVREKIVGGQSTLLRLDQRLIENAAARDATQAVINSTATELAALLLPFGLEVPEPGTEAETRNILDTRRNAYAAQKAERLRADAAFNQAAIRIEECKKSLSEWRRRTGKIADFSKNTLLTLPADSAQTAKFRRSWKSLDDAEAALETLRADLTETGAAAEERRKGAESVEGAVKSRTAELEKRLEGSAFASIEALRAARLKEDQARTIEERKASLEARQQALFGRAKLLQEQTQTLRDAHAPEGPGLEEAARQRSQLESQITAATEKRTTLRNDLARDEQIRQEKMQQAEALKERRKQLATWEQLKQLIGSHDGAKFRQFAQGLSLDVLIHKANRHLCRLSDRYHLRRVAGGELKLEIIDLHQANATRPMESLSGGESFLASLALALGLSDLAGRNVRIDSLFIDEGFGSLDTETLDVALAALDTLRLNNKTVGVISHVELLKERIPVQIRVEKLPGGVSVLHAPRGQ